MAAPNSPQQVLLSQGMAHHQAGRLAEAAQCYARLRAIQPASWEAHHYAGMVALALGRHAEALVLFGRACQLNPRAAGSAVALGLVQLATGDLVSAEKSLRSAVAVEPRNAQAWANLGILLRTQGRLTEAVSAHEKATSLAPRDAQTWLNFGCTLMLTDEVSASLEKFERALALDPRLVAALAGKGGCQFRLHEVTAAIETYRSVLRLEPRHAATWSFLLMALNSVSSLTPAALAEEHFAYGRLFGATPRVLPCSLRQGPLRVALLSSDLRAHSVSYFIRPLLRHAPRSLLSLHVYHDNPREDSVSAELKGLVDTWVNVAGWLDETLEQRLLKDAPDLLLDLVGHTGTSRLAMLARRVAPVQATYLGYPNTTGVPAMDFRLTDEVCDPAGTADKLASERLLRFSSCAWCYEPASDAPDCNQDKDTNDPVFGCFNNFTKITDETLREWGLLLAAVPNARLLLKSPLLDTPKVGERLRGRLRECGVDVSRVQLLGLTPSTRDHLDLYRRIDVALDTSPYNGTTTTCEALWMGVPVVTLSGDRHAARVGESLLRALGLGDWVTPDWAAYRALAATLALQRVAALSGAFAGSSAGDAKPLVAGVTLRERLRCSCLMAGPEQAEAFWTCLLGAARQRLSSEGTESAVLPRGD